MTERGSHQRTVSSELPPPSEPTTPEAPAVAGAVSRSVPPEEFDFDEDTETGPITLPPPRSLRKTTRGMLTVMGGVQAGRVFVLEESEQLIGRAREARVNVDDAGVSRRHAKIERRADGGYQLRDLASTNGVYLNGRRLTREGSEPLAEGDRLQIGPSLLLRFSLPDQVEETLARQLYEASTRDALTSLYNRKYFTARLEAEAAYAERHRTPLGVLLFDIDHFKRINDEHGHAVGDLVIRRVAGRVERSIRREDVLARWGGEEFALLVRGLDAPALAMFAERLRRGIEELAIPVTESIATPSLRAGASLSATASTIPPAGSVKVTASVGVASWSEVENAELPTTLLGLADARLYGGKRGGRNRVVTSGGADTELSS